MEQSSKCYVLIVLSLTVLDHTKLFRSVVHYLMNVPPDLIKLIYTQSSVLLPESRSPGQFGDFPDSNHLFISRETKWY